MNTIPQHNEATALDQAFNALAGELRAQAGALVRQWAINALLHALVLFTLARILNTLEAMVRDWKQGRLPPLRPTPARRATARRTRHPHARTRPCRAPRTPQKRTPHKRPHQAHPLPVTPAHTRCAPVPALPDYSKSAPAAAPTHVHFIPHSK